MSASRPASGYAHTGVAGGPARPATGYAGSAGIHPAGTVAASHPPVIVSRQHLGTAAPGAPGIASRSQGPGAEPGHAPSIAGRDTAPPEAGAGARGATGAQEAERQRTGGADRPGGLAQDDHRPPSVGLTHTSDGRVQLVAAGPRGGAMQPHQDRAFLHADARPGAARDHVAVERDRDFIRAHAGDFRDRDVRRFDARELGLWRAGLWRNEWHYGRRGWWWEANGAWYPYGAPIYPYPLAVAALVAYDTAVVDGPDVEGDQLGPTDGSTVNNSGQAVPYDASAAATDIPPLPAPPAGSYRCGDPNGYYPYVGYCGSDWSLVEEASPSGPASDGSPAAP